jgi:hypothetical protein
MAVTIKPNLTKKIQSLFQRSEWDKARRLLEQEREQDLGNHWLLTQEGVTYYEQRKYETALQFFQQSLQIVPDCPLTLWNLAGTLDTTGNHTSAAQLFAWLWTTNRTVADDPCWESNEWAQSLKTDCVYRLGVCFEHLSAKRAAASCYRHYLALISNGARGTYSSKKVKDRTRRLGVAIKNDTNESTLRRLVDSTLRSLGIVRRMTERDSPPSVDLDYFRPGKRAASKRWRQA